MTSAQSRREVRRWPIGERILGVDAPARVHSAATSRVLICSGDPRQSVYSDASERRRCRHLRGVLVGVDDERDRADQVVLLEVHHPHAGAERPCWEMPPAAVRWTMPPTR